MTTLFAQPHDITADGFYFDSVEDYNENAEKNRNSAGFPVEEYELQFIDGEIIDAALFRALDVNQANFGAFLETCEEWDTAQKQKVIIAVRDVLKKRLYSAEQRKNHRLLINSHIFIRLLTICTV